MKFKKVGLVLGGGGGKGSYQIGVYKYLKERGLTDQIKCISGNSIGALNLTLLANQDVETAEAVWTNLKRRKILTLKNVKNYFDVENFSLFSREGMLDIYKNIDLQKVADSSLTLLVSTYEEDTASGHIFKLNNESKEMIEKIILASSAIPLVFEAIKIGDKHYSDGYQSDNLPVAPLVDEGCDLLFVIPLGTNGEPTPTSYPETTIIDFGDDELFESSTWKGTLGFDAELSKERIEQGYQNAKRLIEYLDSQDFFNPSLWLRFKEWWQTKVRKQPSRYQKYYRLNDK